MNYYLITYLVEINDKVTFLTLIENLSENSFDKSNEIFDKLNSLKNKFKANSVAVHFMREL